MKKLKKYLSLFLLFNIAVAQSTGSVSGKVIDINTKQPLIGSNIQIIKSTFGTATDKNGYFSIEHIPIGTTHIKVSMIGYETRTILNIPITSVRPINMQIEMTISPLTLHQIEVRGNIFPKSAESILSTMNINQIEFRSDPGSRWDVQRVVQTSPSVILKGDHINELIVRGGGPGENLFVMDNIEIQNPNHFALEGDGGGAFSAVVASFIDNVEFTPGAFSSRYGDKASSSMIVSLKEGSRKKYEYDFDISMGGGGFNLDGPIDNGRGSVVIGSLWSYFENIATNVGLTSIPYFNNHQAKLVYDLSTNNKLIINGLYANNRIKIQAEKVIEKYLGVASGEHESNLIVGGISLRSLLGRKGYGLSTISYTNQAIKQRAFDIGAKEFSWFTRDNSLNEITAKTDWFLQTNIGEISSGLSLKYINYDYNEWLNANIIFKYDTTYWDGSNWNLPDSIISPEELSPLYFRPTQQFNINSNFGKLAFFAQHKIELSQNWLLTSGIRFDYFTGTSDLVFSPRINLQNSINRTNTLHLAYGRHYQFPEYFMVLRSDYNKNLNTKYTDQLVLGIEHFFSADFRATGEIYYKSYKDDYTYYYWSNKPETFPDKLEHLLDWDNLGAKNNYGFELLFQKKLSNNWHGILSYSFNNSFAKDLRTFKQVPEPDVYLNDGNWYPWDYDIRHKLTLIGGWKKKFGKLNWYRQLKTKPFYNVVSTILPIADEVEFSFRYAFSNGRPYTTKIYHPELYDWKYSEDFGWNNNRFPDYVRLDLMLLKRHHFKKFNLVLYVNFLNVLGKDNILDTLYNKNGTTETVWHYKTVPIGGLTLEL